MTATDGVDEAVATGSPAPALEGVEARLDSIDERLAERAAARESIIERLHEENQRLRSGELQLMMRPILVDLQRLRNELLAAAGDRQLSQVTDLFMSFAASVELTLERGGVRVLRPAVGSPFDPALHQAVGVAAASDPAGDGLIVAVTDDGYQDTVTERTIVPAKVRVGRWTAPSGDADALAAPAVSETPD